MEKEPVEKIIEPNGPVIFALDTSSRVTSMALARGARVVASFSAELDGKRSQRLWAETGFLLKEAGVSIRDVELFSVCVGPGGFTGLRVGIAAAKGFAAAAARPILGVTSLEAAAFAAGPAPMVCAMVGAYKGEVYWQLFAFDEAGVPVAQTSPAVTSPDKAIECVADLDDVVFAGDAVASITEAMDRMVGERFDREKESRGWMVKPPEGVLADPIAKLSFLKHARGASGDPRDLSACYVRPAEAEIKLSLGLLGSKIRREAGRG
ncbi:MAG: tRNA (adenosine(37)-N6)-threonylcarbamoyltransferase complex dimerization subunit type 1 TsaB [Blastocatellia bacterium]|nr:tRNA (adenosine(37)-N6)-threonylcarbamoyltransferase complex dimerization subunit type 1 TsaB [Blastocatellia bacterium]